MEIRIHDGDWITNKHTLFVKPRGEMLLIGQLLPVFGSGFEYTNIHGRIESITFHSDDTVTIYLKPEVKQNEKEATTSEAVDLISGGDLF